MDRIEFYIDPLVKPFTALPGSYIDPFTRESMLDLIKAHHVKGKVFIIARVEAIDPFYQKESSERSAPVGVFYYAAHYFNKLIFRKYGPLNNCYTFRMHSPNPITNSDILKITYYAIESENINFDDLLDIAESPLLLSTPLNSDLLNQSIAKLQKSFIVEKYSTPSSLDSASEIVLTDSSGTESSTFDSDKSFQHSVNDMSISSQSYKSKVTKSESILNRSIKFKSMEGKDSKISIVRPETLAPKSLSSNQISIFKNYFGSYNQGVSALSNLACQSKISLVNPSSNTPFSPNSISVLPHSCQESICIQSCESSSYSRTSQSIISLFANSSETDIRLSTTEDQILKSQIKPKLDIVNEEHPSRPFSEVELNSNYSQVGMSSSRISITDSIISSSSSLGATIALKALYIGTDDDFLQNPIIRLLFQANALHGEFAELLSIPSEYFSD